MKFKKSILILISILFFIILRFCSHQSYIQLINNSGKHIEFYISCLNEGNVNSKEIIPISESIKIFHNKNYLKNCLSDSFVIYVFDSFSSIENQNDLIKNNQYYKKLVFNKNWFWYSNHEIVIN